ncbi:hypothetical protein Thimo_3293 [Thioflavicoccus mobilis 8321]|uniref:Response regulatory domain-containing protein n=1 Tax=Thioflavicoccus mobilis 8321 TaxID=765912 RepID=L0H199_9GAMM|nr:response regulator [Thioflavicoccus mobilis]AGA91971.1 hypothetical protein Thimo_3293 [Thioflavicoccus mobilis 8321]
MKRRALIIEDNGDIARLVQMHLKDIGCRADIAASGEPKSGSWTAVEVRRAGCPARHKEAQ